MIRQKSKAQRTDCIGSVRVALVVCGKKNSEILGLPYEYRDGNILIFGTDVPDSFYVALDDNNTDFLEIYLETDSALLQECLADPMI